MDGLGMTEIFCGEWVHCVATEMLTAPKFNSSPLKSYGAPIGK